jgi:hypothetical protein
VIFFRPADGTSLPRGLRCPRISPTIRFKALLAGLIAIGSISAAQVSEQGLQPDDEPRSVRGTVINSVTHTAIGRALVYTPDNRLATLTDGEGHFELPLPEVNTDSGTGFVVNGDPHQLRHYERAGRQLWLMARKPGFLDDPNERNEVEASPGSEITISLMPEALIKGRIALSTADAAGGVSVQIFTRHMQEGLPRWMPGTAVRTNSSGEFRFAELPPGAYKVMTHESMDNDPVATIPASQLYGFPPVYYPGVPDFAEAGTIELAAGQTVQADLSLTRQPYFDVKIPVANGEINDGMRVSVRGQRGPGYSLGYNAGDQTIEGMLPSGNYVVEAATPGQNSATGIVNLGVTGTPVEGPTMRLTRNSSISLDVKEEFSEMTRNISGTWSDGKRTFSLHGPRLYLRVEVEDADDLEQPRGGSIRPPTGPNDDALVLENLAPGRYWLRLNSGRGYVASATMGAVDLLHEPLVVGQGTNTPIEIKMRDDTAEIDGTVTTIVATPAAAGASVSSELSSPQAWVYCVPLPDGPGQFQQLAVSADGKFSSPTMAPGSYRVLPFSNRQPNLPYRDAEAMRAYDTKGQVIHLAAGQKASVQVQLIPSSE